MLNENYSEQRSGMGVERHGSVDTLKGGCKYDELG